MSVFTLHQRKRLAENANDRLSSACIDEIKEILMNALFTDDDSIAAQKRTSSWLIRHTTCRDQFE